ncbi:MAG: CaiB/BaiF CoA-transferase family protein [Syntrophorhabdus sp.]|jgi:crotonobetainyl-CoA:carnitine CoA-transferase CaiB-like acyl-CoA transferase|nr:CoA transferase [Syntrophorhabdus sp.]MDI9557964.1 CaiB/BaiF CoA-transferase family protein [Pseudomonadota bacterium]OPX95072.1 MAG: Formyl-coenzyme A transferase [Syntrophorhabdus sp. PtaB.Bin027]OQB78110.1 MAG: Formyl-coenzyme A transferase [Deltaproteobacteria bacterium ADurb.Bin135]MBP8744194.1 CoA transferase [Syntrophorhabdus sp.]
MEDHEIFKDITILSLEQATVLPYLTYRLALEGARVIRMEHPVYGDPNRRVGENRLNEDRMYTYFLAINCQKEAITLDLGTPEGLEIFKKLLIELKVDVFATNQLPRNYKKLGIDYEMVKAIKPDIIWVGLTGFGPESNEAAYDPILQARGGLMELTGDKNSSPYVLGVPLPDMGASEHGYGQIMKALFKRASTGEGSRIDVSMFQSTVSWLTVAITQTKSFNKAITRRGNTHEFFAPVSVYKTKDGYAYIAVGNDIQWERMLKISGFETLEKQEYTRNEGRIKDVDNLNIAIEKVTIKYSTEELISLFTSATIPISKVNTISEVIEDPHINREILSSTDKKTGTTIYLAPPPVTTSFVKSLHKQLVFPPRFGEHNESIYAQELGYSKVQLDEYKNKGVI